MLLFYVTRTVIWILRGYLLLLFIRALLSWFSIMPGNRIVYYLTRVTEPVLSVFRKILRKTGINNNLPIDLSYLAAFLTLGLLINILYFIR